MAFRTVTSALTWLACALATCGSAPGLAWASPPPPDRVNVAPPTGRPVPAAGATDWVALYSAFAKTHAVTVGAGEVEREIADLLRTGRLSDAFREKVKAPYTDIPSLYVADIDNDTSADYVLTDRNSTGLHNDRIVGVYRIRDGAVVEVPVPAEGPFTADRGWITYFESPFLSVDPEGTTMHITLNAPPARRYLWKGGHIQRLGASASERDGR